jgi:hypothetical protein
VPHTANEAHYRGYLIQQRIGGRVLIRSDDGADIKLFTGVDKAKNYIDTKENE